MHISVLNPFSYTKTAATICCVLAGGLLFVACTTETQQNTHTDMTLIKRPMTLSEKPSEGSMQKKPCIYGQMGAVGMLTDTPSQEAPIKLELQTAAPVEESSPPNPLAERLEKLNAQYQQFYSDYMSLLSDMQTLAAVKDNVTSIKKELSGISVLASESSPLANTEMVVMNDGTVLRRTISPDPLESSVSAVDRPIDITTLRTTKEKPTTIEVTQEAPPQKAVIVAKAEPAKPAHEKTAEPENSQPTAQNKTATESKSVEQSLLNGTFLSAANRVRIGEHPSKKRFVIDFAPGSIIDYKHEQANHDLTLTLADTAWHGRTSWTSSNSDSPIKGYTVKTDEKGSVLHINLSDKASVKKLFDMPPESPTEGPKLVIDVAD